MEGSGGGRVKKEGSSCVESAGATVGAEVVLVGGGAGGVEEAHILGMGG